MSRLARGVKVTQPLACRVGAEVLVALLAVACGPGTEPGPTGQAVATTQPLAETSREDAMAEAPWRVQDADSVIPFDVVVADAYRAGLILSRLTLHYVGIAVWKQGAWVPFYYREFGEADLAASTATDHLWLLHVVEGYGAGLIDGLPITARNLMGASFSSGAIDFIVQVSTTGTSVGKGTGLFTIRLQTRVAGVALPHARGLFADWYAGDPHSHTMYTHNWAEYGLPHRSLLHAAHAIGLDWILTTDHSCDLDPTCPSTIGFDNIGTRIDKWTFCSGGQAMPCTVRDHTSFSDGFAMAADDARDAENWAASWSSVKFGTGEEVNVLSQDGKTIHMLAYGSPYIASPGSGLTGPLSAFECDAVSLGIAGALGQVAAAGTAFAAHPTQLLASNLGGGSWKDADVTAALASPTFAGFELWNMRKARTMASPGNPEGTNGLDPFQTKLELGSLCDSASDPHECFPYFLDQEALPYWDTWLSRSCLDPTKRTYAIAGSDSHGGFNYDTQSSDGTSVTLATDNALGRVRTVVLAPSRAITDIIASLKAGRAVMTDGPMMTIGVDATGDGTIDQTEDVQVGSRTYTTAADSLRLRFKWQSSTEFGPLTSVLLARGDGASGASPLTYDVRADVSGIGDCGTADGTAARCSVVVAQGSGPVSLPKVGETYYFRAEAYTAGRASRVLTNPIWVTTADCWDRDGDSYYAGPGCSLVPAVRQHGIDCNDADSAVKPGAPETCNGVDDNCDGQIDEGLGSTTCGVGVCQRTLPNCAAGRPQSCMPGSPSIEICNGLDDDCDGEIDEGGVCDAGGKAVKSAGGCSCAVTGGGGTEPVPLALLMLLGALAAFTPSRSSPPPPSRSRPRSRPTREGWVPLPVPAPDPPPGIGDSLGV